MIGVLMERGRLDTGRAPGEDAGRDGGAVSPRQGTPETVNASSETRREAGNRLSSQPPEGTTPAHTLILDFWPPEL